MKYLFFFVFACCLCACQKSPDTPLTVGKQLEGTWKVHSYIFNDTIDFLSEYRSYTFEFRNFNNRYGTLSEIIVWNSGFKNKYDFFYTVNDDGTFITKYLNEEDVSSNFDSGGWGMKLKKDSLTLIIDGDDGMGNKIISVTKATRIK